MITVVLVFYHYLELHHSQTNPRTVSVAKVVLPLSGITSLSNLKFQSQFAYLLKFSTSKTAITWQCNPDMATIYSKI